MKRLIQLNLLLLLISSATAQESQPQEETLQIFDWKGLNVQSTNCQIQIISMDGTPVLKIENTNDVPIVVSLLKIDDSALIGRADFISCEMGRENVRENHWIETNDDRSISIGGMFGGRLDLTQVFPPIAVGGVQITNNDWYNFSGGTENWAQFNMALRHPSYANLPKYLELKLYLLASGAVYLRPIKLLGMANNSNGWWSPQQAGLIGGIGGSIIGCFGGLIGWLVSKGKARRFVLAATTSSIVLGILLTVGGLVAAFLKQPYSVWYALLFPGVILVLVFSLNLHSIQRRYDELEIRRMTSVDTMGG